MGKRQTSSGHLHDPLWIVTLTQGLQGNRINTTFWKSKFVQCSLLLLSELNEPTPPTDIHTLNHDEW